MCAACGLGSGCGDWPHLDYASQPLQEVAEIESPDGEQTQDLSMLEGDVLISGEISSGEFVVGAENYFDLDGWYTGDMDWFQFTVRDDLSLTAELSWTDAGGDLDLYLFSASRETGVLEAVVSRSGGQDLSPVTLELNSLPPEPIYVLAVGPYQGSPLAYQLYLHL